MTAQYKTHIQRTANAMARPREFNEQEVIDRAVDVFWRKGFADTSIGDLEQALGMGRQSIYNAFGDKRALFIRALQHYYNQGSETITSVFNEERRGLDSVYSYFALVVDNVTHSDERRGCFLIKCLMDQGTRDSEVASRCQSNDERLFKMFRKALEEAHQDRVLPDSLDLDATATLLATQVYGLNVMARSGASKETLQRSVSALLKHLVR